MRVARVVRRLRFGLLLVIPAVTAGAGCTTSRAVRAWHAGAAAEKAGDLDRARRRYAEAYGRDGKLVGSELARLRLVARSPAARQAVDEELQALIKKKGTLPEVAIFAAWWALLRADLGGAGTQLAAVSVPDKHPRAAALRAEVGRCRRALAAAERRERLKRDGAAKSTLEQERVAARRLAAGRDRAAADILAGLVAFGRGLHWSSYFNLGIARLRMGDLAAARRAFSDAARRCPRCASARHNAELLARMQGPGRPP